MGKILSVCLVGYFVFVICQSAVAISANTEHICRSGGYADSVACQLYKSGFSSSSSMACDMCVSIMGCISDYLSSGTGVSRAIQLCRETGFDGGDIGMIMDIIAEDALNGNFPIWPVPGFCLDGVIIQNDILPVFRFEIANLFFYDNIAPQIKDLLL